eukprot:scaffold2.g6778.t1
MDASLQQLELAVEERVRAMPMEEFSKEYPEDFQSGALKEIHQRYAAMAAEAAKPAATTAKRGRSEASTSLRTVRPRRGPVPLAPPPKFSENLHPVAAPAAETASRRSTRSRTVAPGVEQQQQQPEERPTGRRGVKTTATTFNGMPLQTPMPFVGEAVPLPITLLTQKRGGRTAGGTAPEAAIITTGDGRQWAVGKSGMAAIPESHRQEVEGLLSAQFEFIAAALGKTVFSRGRR